MFPRCHTPAVLVILGILTCAPQLRAFTPAVSHLQPRGGQRGTEVAIHLYGERLFDPEELHFYKPGLTVKNLESVGDKHKQVRATLAIAPDAPLGEHPMRLRCKGGVTYLRTFWVGQFPTVMEERTKDRKADTNNDFNAPQAIPINSTVQGVADNEDVDYYRVKCKKGQRLSVEVEGMRLGRILFDPYVAILNSRRFELASSDDTALLFRDCAASIAVPEDGDYVVMVRESSYKGRPQCQYRLHVGEFPRPMAVFPPGGKPGEEREFTFVGDPTGDLKSNLKLPGEEVVHRALVESGGLSSPSGIPVRVSELPYFNEVEPNEGTKQATPLDAPEVPVAFHGVLSKKEDKDWFRFRAKKGQKLVARVHARSLRSPLDSVIIVRPEAGGKALGYNDDATNGDPDSRLALEIPADGVYTINIRDQLYGSGPDYTYRVEIAPRAPALSAALPTAARNDSQKEKMICVPRGNRVARVVNLTRKNIGCDVEIASPDLPKGVALDADTAPRTINAFPVVFTAKADAPAAGALSRFEIKDPKTGTTGRITETINHVEINNAGAFHSTGSDRIMVAVIEEAPFHLELEVPPVPLVKNGTMNLKVVAKREEGFDGKITVTLPWKPPGVGAPASVEIPKGANEASIRIDANASAPVRTWRVCAQASASTPRGPVLVSSPLVPLEIGEPYVAMTIEMAATQPGEDTELVCKLDQRREFGGKATVKIHGLPHGVKAGDQQITKDSKEVAFPLEVAGDARKGKHASLFCVVLITKDGHPIPHSVGSGGTLRIDPPPPAPKKPTADAGAKPSAKPQPATNKKKQLSRLEQLRLRNAKK